MISPASVPAATRPDSLPDGPVPLSAETLDELERVRPELARSQHNLHAAQLKIQALTLELAHHKRLRFGQKSEALARGQADLFNETARIDQAAIEAELAQLTRPSRVPSASTQSPRRPSALAGSSATHRAPTRT